MTHSSSQKESPPIEWYRELVAAFPNGVVVLFGDELRYRIVGPAVLPFSGREASTMVGKTIFDLFPEEYATELEPELEATISGSARSFDMEHEGLVHHIETQPIEIQGAKFGVLVTQEVTEERERQVTLEDQKRRLETVASVLSHDLRSPLNVALGHLDSIDSETPETDDSIAKIRQALLRMDTIMSDALVLARETTLTDVESVDLEAHVDAAWQIVPTEAATLQTEGTMRVNADPGLFANLLENLIRNAVSHGGSGVTVRVGTLSNRSGFFVEDNGSGIDSSLRESVFEAGVTTESDDEHSGMGLSIVKEIATEHGWSVELREAASGGARFEFTGVSSQ